MDIEQFIKGWISVSNSYDTEKYLDFYNDQAILDDPSVGQKFEGKEGIRNYFESYFIGYNTHTKLILLTPKGNERAYVEVEFTGNFPGGIIGGTFDFTFKKGKIESVKADLL